jgi:predicted transcriptional regulator
MIKGKVAEEKKEGPMRNRSYQELMTIIEKNQQSLPIDVKSIAHALQIQVYMERGWPNGLSGKIVKDARSGGQSGYAIYINGAHAETRQRFTLAHEIAHFVLHKENIGDGIADDALYRSGLSNAQEAMANKLAADILMPWNLVNQRIQEGVDTIEELAEQFNVSISAMAIRVGVPS